MRPVGAQELYQFSQKLQESGLHAIRYRGSLRKRYLWQSEQRDPNFLMDLSQLLRTDSGEDWMRRDLQNAPCGSPTNGTRHGHKMLHAWNFQRGRANLASPLQSIAREREPRLVEADAKESGFIPST